MRLDYASSDSGVKSSAMMCGKERNFVGEHLWARGYAVSTVGFELDAVKRYVREQEEADEAGRF